MKKILLIGLAFICINILLLIPSIMHYRENPQDSLTQVAQQQEVKLFKYVPVKITKIQQTYYFKGMFKIYVEYKSDEYVITQSMTIGNNEPYANECYNGQYKVGDTIYAVMCSWQQGDTVTRRELGNLDYKK